MKLAIVYNPLDSKLRPDTYSYIYRGMLEAIAKRFKPLHIIKDCSAQDIEADVILFFDINSCHHIKIDGIGRHPALKLEYFSDPFQDEFRGIYRKYNMPVHKLGAKQRLMRVLERGVKYIISPNKAGYFKYFAPYLGEEQAEDMLLYFPQAPCFTVKDSNLVKRKQKVLANGATTSLKNGYMFRRWAFQRPNVTLVPHVLADENTPMGKQYGEFLSKWAGALALAENYPVNKYYEMPMAGCVTFMQYYEECEELGFKDHETCIYVNKGNFDNEIKDFLNNIPAYQMIADAGKKLMQENYTAKHFAEFVHRKLKEYLHEKI